MTFRWVELSFNSEALVDERDEIHATVTDGWRRVRWGEREFLTREAAKRAVEEAKGMRDADLPL